MHHIFLSQRFGHLPPQLAGAGFILGENLVVKVYTIASLYPTPTVQAIQTRRHSLTPCRQLDNAVAAWPHDLTDGQILNRVRLLNLERAREEENGIIRWIVPEKKTSILYFNVKTKGNSKAELPA